MKSLEMMFILGEKTEKYFVEIAKRARLALFLAQNA